MNVKTKIKSESRPFDLTIGIAFLAFVVLGLPEGLLGLAFPSMREEFNLSIDAIGFLLLAGTVGYTTMSFNLGTIIARIGTNRTLILSALLRSVALFAFFLAPSWELIILASFIMGFGTGGVDAGMNAYVAGYRNLRLLNWLHAFFGVGATIGPVIMTVIFEKGLSWQAGYAFVSAVQFIVFVVLFMTRDAWSAVDAERAEQQKADDQPINIWVTLRMPFVFLGIALFILTTGVEMTAGNLTPTLFIDGRNLDENLIAGWITFYWGSFTIGRFIYGMLGNRNVTQLIRLSGATLLIGIALIWANPSELGNFIGLGLIGFALAPIFPLMIANTERTLGGHLATRAIGIQMVGASLGFSVIPWIAGLLAENIDLEIISPYMFVLGVALIVLYEVQRVIALRQQRELA